MCPRRPQCYACCCWHMLLSWLTARMPRKPASNTKPSMTAHTTRRMHQHLVRRKCRENCCVSWGRNAKLCNYLLCNYLYVRASAHATHALVSVVCQIQNTSTPYCRCRCRPLDIYHFNNTSGLPLSILSISIPLISHAWRAHALPHASQGDSSKTTQQLPALAILSRTTASLASLMPCAAATAMACLLPVLGE